MAPRTAHTAPGPLTRPLPRTTTVVRPEDRTDLDARATFTLVTGRTRIPVQR